MCCEPCLLLEENGITASHQCGVLVVEWSTIENKIIQSKVSNAFIKTHKFTLINEDISYGNSCSPFVWINFYNYYILYEVICQSGIFIDTWSQS